MAYRMIQVGAGGFGGHWCEHFLPPNVRDGLIEVVAAVDTDPAALGNAKRCLGLRDEQCYTDLKRALDNHAADFLTVVVPPAHHESVVDLALEHGLHILSEKPIADTLEGAVRIADKVKRAGTKMGVTMSHRFDQDKSSLRALLRSGDYGTLDYLVMRFTCPCRIFGSWGRFRHEIPDPLMVEGAVHHLDILADMAGAKCETIYAETWNPRWGEYRGGSQGLLIMHFENGVRAVYEGAKTNAVGLNCWGSEYIRAECELATLIMDHRKLESFPFVRGKPRLAEHGQGEALPLLDQPKWSNSWLIENFARWLDGGEPMETNVEDNLQSVALVFAAIESSGTGMPVNVQELLARTRTAVQSGQLTA